MKLSKYTYMLNTEENKTILYNARIGFDSICKLNKETVDEIIEHLGFLDETRDVVLYLKKKGHLIDKEADETVFLKELYSRIMNDDTLRLIILPTEKCNFKCIYCYEQFINGRMNEQNIEQLIEFVKRKIKGKKKLVVEWFGGEPLIEIDLIEKLSFAFMELCKKNKKMYVASVTTNAYLLDLNMFDRLYAAKVLSYQITVDGTAEKHNKQRPLLDGRPTFEKIMDNLKNISTERKKARVNITLRTNCMLDMGKELEQYLEFIDKLFGKDKRFGVLLRPVMDFGGTRVEDLKDELFDYKTFGEMIENSYRYINTSVYRQLLSPGGQVCYAAKRDQYTIGSDGSIFKCTCDFENKDVTQIGDLINGVSDYKYCEWLLDMEQAEEKCEECFYLPVCMGDACPRKRIGCKDEYRCPIEYSMMDSILRIMDKRKEIESYK